MKKTVAVLLTAAAVLYCVGCAERMPPNKVYAAEDLKGRKIGVVSGTPATVFADGFGTLNPYKSGDTMLVDLKNGVIDCAVMEESAAKSTIRKVPALKILPRPLIKAELCFAIAKENPDLRKAVNAALKTLGDNGTLSKLVEGYKTTDGYRYTSPSNVNLSLGTLMVAVFGNFPPYAYDDGYGQLTGIDIDVAHAVCDILHMKMKLLVVDRNALVTDVEYGKADLALGGLTSNESDLKHVDFSASYARTTQVIIVRQ